MKLLPIPFAKIKLILPFCIFLSECMCVRILLGFQLKLSTSVRYVGNPILEKCFRVRSVSDFAHNPNWSDRSKAKQMPILIDSPCKSLLLNPVSVSRAWPNVWPRLSNARIFCSVSSFAIISAVDLQLLQTAVRRYSWLPAHSFWPNSSSQEKKLLLFISPYFTTSA